MELAQLHRTHVCGEERLSQLQCRNGVLLQGQKMDSVCNVFHTPYLKVYIRGMAEFLLYRQSMEATDSEVNVWKAVTVYLNNVATKSPPETLLFGIVELIIGEVPWVLYFRLGHILSTQTSQF